MLWVESKWIKINLLIIGLFYLWNNRQNYIQYEENLNYKAYFLIITE